MKSVNPSLNSSFTLEAQCLGKSYEEGTGHELHVLRNINFTVQSGDTIAIIGSSGSGKTTLLNMLGGLDDASTGKVLINNQDIEKLNEKQRSKIRNKHMGFVYQFHHLLPEFTALENVAMPLLIAGEKVNTASEKAAKILDEIGLSQRMHHKPSELSGGERQRVAIVRAVIHQPDCVFADEPTGNLDSANAEQAIELIMQLNTVYKTSLVMVTHDLAIAEKMQTVYTIRDGQLVI